MTPSSSPSMSGGATRPAPMPPGGFTRKASMQVMSSPSNGPIPSRPAAYVPLSSVNGSSMGSSTTLNSLGMSNSGSVNVNALASEFNNRLDGMRSKSISMPRPGQFGAVASESALTNGLGSTAAAAYNVA
jgi:hypothetical protein